MPNTLMPDFCKLCGDWYNDGLEHYLNVHPESDIPRYIAINWILTEDRCSQCFQLFEEPRHHLVQMDEDGPEGLDNQGKQDENHLDVFECVRCSAKVFGSREFEVSAYVYVSASLPANHSLFSFLSGTPQRLSRATLHGVSNERRAFPF